MVFNIEPESENKYKYYENKQARDIRQTRSNRLKHIKERYHEVESDVQTKTKDILFWQRLYYIAGFISFLASLISLILTFSDYKAWITLTSLVSSISLTVVAFLRPLEHYVYLKELQQSCELIKQDISDAESYLENEPNISEESMLAALERIGERIRELAKKIYN